MLGFAVPAAGFIEVHPNLNHLFGADGVELVLNGRRAFRDYRLRTQRYAVLVAHRRCGKTVACVQGRIDRSTTLALPHGRYAYVAPGQWPGEGGPLKNRGQPGAPEERPKLRGPAKIGEAAKLRTRPCGYRSIPSAPGLSILTRL